MEAILILAHGSREKQTETTFDVLIDLVRSQTGQIIETAFMEFSPRSITAGLENLATQGAKRIRVIPYFLFTGVHIKKDIPEEIAAFRQNNPDLDIILEDVIGTDPLIVDIVTRRIRG